MVMESEDWGFKTQLCFMTWVWVSHLKSLNSVSSSIYKQKAQVCTLHPKGYWEYLRSFS